SPKPDCRRKCSSPSEDLSRPDREPNQTGGTRAFRCRTHASSKQPNRLSGGASRNNGAASRRCQRRTAANHLGGCVLENRTVSPSRTPVPQAMLWQRFLWSTGRLRASTSSGGTVKGGAFNQRRTPSIHAPDSQANPGDLPDTVQLGWGNVVPAMIRTRSGAA